MENDLSVKLTEILASKAVSPEEKKVQALIKAALLSDNVQNFINEVKSAMAGFGKVKLETVKGLVDYAKAHNEAQIRNMMPLEKQDEFVENENNRIIKAEVWALGTLALLGLLEE